MEDYRFPFGERLHRLAQEDRTPKKVFVLGVYASAVHARWMKDGTVICPALAVASEPRIFWDGNEDEAREIIGRIKIPAGLGTLSPAGKNLNGPSAKVLDEQILKPLGFKRSDAWLCDLLPESRINKGQSDAIEGHYNKYIEIYHLNPVTVPKRKSSFCDAKRAQEILKEIEESDARLLVLLGDIPIKQFLTRVADIPYSSLQEYVDLYGYGNPTDVTIQGKTIKVLPLAHPRQIGALGYHSETWYNMHQEWEKKR
ncbi:MAG: hypothetical protein J6P66_00015 [Bacteroidaceae bacterium]|nr:hypothetical protein [Bacteroidaceae bacterium]